jgi:hypothetical protein
MLQETKKTHKEVKLPRMSVRQLADYMAASEQSRRGIAQNCKYRAIARIVQHNEAKAVISNHILSGVSGPGDLQKKAEFIRNKLADSDFESDLNDHNADYIERFIEGLPGIELPQADRLQSPGFAPLMLSGVNVTFRPELLLQRKTKSNKIKMGALMLRYGKNSPLSPTIGGWQSAAIFGYMKTLEDANKTEAERALCITLDAYAGKCHEAPSNAVYLFKEIKAACATIAERWPAIKPPKNAVL